MKGFGARLKELRLEHGMTISQASVAVGLSKNAFANYEADTREPSYEVLKQICELFAVSADYLLGITEV